VVVGYAEGNRISFVVNKMHSKGDGWVKRKTMISRNFFYKNIPYRYREMLKKNEMISLSFCVNDHVYSKL